MGHSNNQPESAFVNILIPRKGGMTLNEIERILIEATLSLTGGNQSAAARMLAISRPTLDRKIYKYGLRVERYYYRPLE